MPKAMAICGHICSGKSRVINHLSNEYRWAVISFGNYVKHLAQRECLPATRDSYQALGQKLLEGKGPKQFLLDVIEFHNPTSPLHLFDGVRHTSIIDELRQMYEGLSIIYLQVSDAVRYERFLKRRKKDEPLFSLTEFLALSEHPIERGISAIASVADQSIDGSTSFAQVLAKVKSLLEEQVLLR